jgi:hypothetical protein
LNSFNRDAWIIAMAKKRSFCPCQWIILTWITAHIWQRGLRFNLERISVACDVLEIGGNPFVMYLKYLIILPLWSVILMVTALSNQVQVEACRFLSHQRLYIDWSFCLDDIISLPERKKWGDLSSLSGMLGIDVS